MVFGIHILYQSVKDKIEINLSVKLIYTRGQGIEYQKKDEDVFTGPVFHSL
jgi:hypothetical protein